MRENDDKIDALEAMLIGGEKINCPLTHRFTPGIYTREIFMPAGTIVTSMVHKTKHQFIVLEGEVSVFSDNNGEELIEAPFVGITDPGTRRVLLVHKNTRWLTIHKTNICPKNDTNESIEEAVFAIGIEILEPYVNKVLGAQLKNNCILKEIEDD